MASNPASCHLSGWGAGALFHLPNEGMDGDGYGVWEDAGLAGPHSSGFLQFCFFVNCF